MLVHPDASKQKDAISGFPEKQLRLVQVKLTAGILNAQQLDEGAWSRPKRVKCAFARPERWRMMELDLFLVAVFEKSADLKFLSGPVVILSCCSATAKEGCDTGPHQGSNHSLNLLENEKTAHVEKTRRGIERENGENFLYWLGIIKMCLF